LGPRPYPPTSATVTRCTGTPARTPDSRPEGDRNLPPPREQACPRAELPVAVRSRDAAGLSRREPCVATVVKTGRAPCGTEPPRGEKTKRRTRYRRVRPKSDAGCRHMVTTAEFPSLAPSRHPSHRRHAKEANGSPPTRRGRPRHSPVQRSAKRRCRDEHQGAFHRGNLEEPISKDGARRRPSLHATRPKSRDFSFWKWAL